MKHFLHKKWLSIPVVVMLVLALVTGSVFAAYSFLGFSTAITVDEPLTIEMAWYDYTDNMTLTAFWVVGEGGDELTLDISPAETQKLAIRISNNSYGALKVNTLFTGQVGHFVFNGWPDSSSLTGGEVAGSDDDPLTYEWEGDVTIVANGDTPEGIYTVNVAFTRK